jgi:hypothetical protein
MEKAELKLIRKPYRATIAWFSFAADGLTSSER